MSRRAHTGTHGGAWKVAYADFVTAMMALFLVLWLVGSDTETKQAVQRYFKGEKTQQGRAGRLKYSENKPFSTLGEDKSSREFIERETLQRAMEQLREQLKNSSELGEDQVRFEFTADGIRIMALDSSKHPLFEPNGARLTEFGSWLLTTLAWVIEQYPFKVEVEGHTQKGLEEGPRPGQIWDLSTERANNARAALEKGGVNPVQFYRVAGYADRMPLNVSHPEAEENRRISIMLRMREGDNFQKAQEIFSETASP